MAYDFEGARAAGLSDAQINDYLSKKYEYDISGARKAGLDESAILSHLSAKETPKPSVDLYNPYQQKVEAPEAKPAEEPGVLGKTWADLEKVVPGLSTLSSGLQKGFIGAKSGLTQNQLAGLVDIQEARRAQYGPNLEKAPEAKKEEFAADQKVINKYLQELAGYGVERKQIEDKYGVNPIVQQLRNTAAERDKDPSFFSRTGNYIGTVAKNPSDIPGYIASIGLESLPQSMTTLISALAARYGGFGPTGAAIAGGATSAFNEFGNQYADLRSEGMSHKEAWEKAGVKSGVIGLFDAASFKSAGSLGNTLAKDFTKKGALKETVKDVSKETGKQAFYGGAGEAGGSLAIGQKLDPQAIAEEAVGEIFSAPGEAVSTYKGKALEAREAKQQAEEKAKVEANTQFEVDAKGNLVPKTVTAPTETKPVAPIPTEGQVSLFAPEEIPTAVSQPLTATTPAGTTVERQDLTDAQVRQSEIERQIFGLQQQEQTPQVQQQIQALQGQLEATPEQRATQINDEYTQLLELKNQAEAQRKEVKKLDDKAKFTTQIDAIDARLAEMDTEIESLRKQGVSLASPREQRTLKPVSPIVNNVMSKFGLPPRVPVRQRIKNLDMTDPADRAKLEQEIFDFDASNPGKVNLDAVTEYLSYFEEGKNVPSTRDDTGRVEPSVPVPGGRVEPTTTAGVPDTTGMVSDIGAPVRPTGGEEAAPGVGAPALEQPAEIPTTEETQKTPERLAEEEQARQLFGEEGGPDTTLLRSGFTAEDAAKAVKSLLPEGQPTPTPEGEEILKNLDAAGGATPPKKASGWFNKDTTEADKAYENNSFMSKVKDAVGLTNLFSFDDGLMKITRKVMMDLADEGKITLDQAVKSLRRIEITQVLARSQLATDAINKGRLLYNAIENRYRIVEEADNMNDLKTQLRKLSERTGMSIDNALAAASKAFEANRMRSVYEKMDKTSAKITRTEKKIASLEANRQRTKAEQKDLDTKKALLKELKANKDLYTSQTQHMTRAQVQSGMKIYNDVPELQEAARIWEVMRKRTVDKLVESGVTSEEKAERWLDEMAYVPFFRQVKEQQQIGTQIIKKGLAESMKEYGFEGSMLPVENTIGNMYQWMHWSYSRAISNQHMQVTLDQIKAVLPDMIKEGRHENGKTFVVYRDGVKREYTATNPSVVQFFMGTGAVAFPGINAASMYRELFTKTITLLPGFAQSQLILKDTWEAMHTSGVKNPYGLLKNVFYEIGKTALHISDAREKLISRGAISTREHAMAVTGYSDITQKLELKEPAIHRKILGVLNHFAALNDNVLRQAVFQQLVDEGMSESDAADRAAEIFNYRRTSGNPVMQFANNVVPFMNAWGVSTRVAIRTVSGTGISPQTRAAGYEALFSTSALLAAGTFMYMLMVGDDDEYKKMNRFKRDASFVIPGTGKVIPLRPGWFLVDKLIAEYTYNLMKNPDITDEQMMKDALKRAMYKQIEPPVGGLVAAPLGVALNKDLYTGRDIVNKSQERLLPGYQVAKNTSEASKALGESLGVSPLKLDYFLNTFFGSAMPIIAAVTNDAIATARGVRRPAQKGMSQDIATMLGAGSFTYKEGSSNVAPDFYQAANEIKQNIATIKELAKTDKDKARELLRKNEGRLADVNATEQVFSELNRAEALIRNAPATKRAPDGRLYTPEVKKEMIDKINAQREKLQPQVMNIRKKVYE